MIFYISTTHSVMTAGVAAWGRSLSGNYKGSANAQERILVYMVYMDSEMTRWEDVYTSRVVELTHELIMTDSSHTLYTTPSSCCFRAGGCANRTHARKRFM